MDLKATVSRAWKALGRMKVGTWLGLGMAGVGAAHVAAGGAWVDVFWLVFGGVGWLAATWHDGGWFRDEPLGLFAGTPEELRRGFRLPFRILSGLVGGLCVVMIPMLVQSREWYGAAFMGLMGVGMLALTTVGYLWPASVWRERRRRLAAGEQTAGALGPGAVDWSQAVEREARRIAREKSEERR